MNRLEFTFLNDRGLRAGWRFFLYVLLLDRLSRGLFWVLPKLGYTLSEGWDWPSFLFEASLDFSVALLVALLLWRFEKNRPFSDYGFPLSFDAPKLLLKGLIWGFIPSALILIPIWLLGACSFHGFALHGSARIVSALGWALAWLALGFSEEFAFRGYSLRALADGIGFWPAAIALSVLFGAVHYFLKPMENWIDPVSVGLYGLFWSLNLKRTGSLWFGVGFHAMSDYSDMIVFGEPNTGNQGQSIPGYLLDVRFHGPDWITGGPRGTEASLFVFVILAGLFYFFDKAYPAKEKAMARSSSK